MDPDSSLLPTYEGISIGLTIRTRENTVEIENHHTSDSEEMKLTNMPADMTREVRWVFFKLNRKLVIRCKGVQVWEMEYIKLFDTKHDNAILSQRSMRAWSKTVVEIEFDQHDTGTSGYRKRGKILSDLIDIYCEDQICIRTFSAAKYRKTGSKLKGSSS